MGLIAEAYDDMCAVVRSADRLVTITVSGRGGVEVELADDVAATHSEEQLALQGAGAARVALAAYRSQQQEAIVEAVEQSWSAR